MRRGEFVKKELKSEFYKGNGQWFPQQNHSENTLVSEFQGRVCAQLVTLVETATHQGTL